MSDLLVWNDTGEDADHSGFLPGNDHTNTRHSPVYHVSKRAVDCVLAGIGLIALSPLFLLIAIVIRLDSPGPVLFSQLRVGKHGKPFRCWKFRSMAADAESRKHALASHNEMADGLNFKIRRDPRITSVGRFIRKASIDELPQLWNVFSGDMALVGPRPAVPEEVEKYTLHQRRRLAVLPGITCFWQISGRSTLPFREQVRLDIEYIQKCSLMTDFVILLRTIPAVLTARGAY